MLETREKQIERREKLQGWARRKLWNFADYPMQQSFKMIFWYKRNGVVVECREQRIIKAKNKTKIKIKQTNKQIKYT